MSKNYFSRHIDQAPVVQTLDSAIHRINNYPVDKYFWNQLRYPLDIEITTWLVSAYDF